MFWDWRAQMFLSMSNIENSWVCYTLTKSEPIFSLAIHIDLASHAYLTAVVKKCLITAKVPEGWNHCESEFLQNLIELFLVQPGSQILIMVFLSEKVLVNFGTKIFLTVWFGTNRFKFFCCFMYILNDFPLEKKCSFVLSMCPHTNLLLLLLRAETERFIAWIRIFNNRKGKL